MRSSTAPRESLIPKLYLCFIAILLGLGFAILMPSHEAYQFNSPDAAVGSTENVDELDLAYLKARSASGDLRSDEVRNVVFALIRNQRWREAKLLLAQRPDVQLSAKDQYLLDLEAIDSRRNAATTQAEAASYQGQLIRQLSAILSDKTLHSPTLVVRATQLSQALNQPELGAALYLLLASDDEANRSNWFEKCANVLSAAQIHAKAANCFQSAIAHSSDPDKRYQLSLRMIHHLTADGDREAEQSTLETLASNVPADIEQIHALAKLALSLGRADLAYPLYARLADLEPDNAIAWLEQAARWSLASNLPGLSAEYVLTLSQLVEPDRQAELASKRQQLLIAAGRSEDALDTIVSRMDQSPKNAELLVEAITLAGQMGLQPQAMEWNENLLRIRPYDTQAMDRQIRFALATKQLDSARYWAQRAISLSPNNRDLRLQLAQLEEWTGNPEDALPHWTWLAKRFPNQRHLQQQIRLAEMGWQFGTAADALGNLAKLRPLSNEETLKLIELYEQDGRPQQAVAALQNTINQRGKTPLLLRELALLNQRHMYYPAALEAWQELAVNYGHSGEELLNRMELNWRLQQPLVASQISDLLTDVSLEDATRYQIELMSEIGWRYQKPALLALAKPLLEGLDLDNDHRVLHGRRIVQALVDNASPAEAVAEAETFWRETGDEDFVTLAMEQVFTHELYPQLERYLDAEGELAILRQSPAYWADVAQYQTRRADAAAAADAFNQSLRLDPNDTSALAGLIWTYLGADDREQIKLFIAQNLEQAMVEPSLWAPYAMAHLRIGEARNSLQWFSKLMERDEHDYNVLLTFSEALEQSGNHEHAYRVRSHAIEKLRPLILAQQGDQTEQLVRSYVSLLAAHGDVGENERWTKHLLAGINAKSDGEEMWREEMAIAWYLSSQRHDYARLLMTRMHEQRITTPAWQQLALAMQSDNLPKVQEILASGSHISDSDRLIALSKLGREPEAYAMAQKLTLKGKNVSVRNLARNQYVALRYHRPSYYGATAQYDSSPKLNISEAGMSLRHTLAGREFGLGVEYSAQDLNSDTYPQAARSQQQVAITTHFGNSRKGGKILAGVISTESHDQPYVKGSYYQQNRQGTSVLSSEVAINAESESSAEFRLAGKEHRAELAFEKNLGVHEYIRLGGNVNAITSRLEDEPVANGVGGSVEMGLKGKFGSNQWKMGVLATGFRNDRESRLPDEILALSTNLTMDQLLSAENASLSLSGSLQRGGIRSDYPQAGTPRYHLRARVGHNWPFNNVALQVQAGAGFRVLGDDELSIALTHDSNAALTGENTTSNSLLGIHYRSHF